MQTFTLEDIVEFGTVSLDELSEEAREMYNASKNSLKSTFVKL